MTVAAIVFWVSCGFVGYVYLGYPLLLLAWARLRPRSVTDDRSGSAPAISIVVAARDEGARLAARVENLLQLAYPAPRQIIVVSDGSCDDTLDVLARYRQHIDVVALPRGGKARALNAGVIRARHEILVFADARQMFEPDALTALTAPFADPGIGAVTGELILDCEHHERRSGADRRRSSPLTLRGCRRAETDRRTPQSTIADGIGLYWKYEKSLRKLESAVGSVVGATGAIYAMRRGLWRPLPPETILDDVLAPMRCVLAGYRVVFNDRARARDHAASNADVEARRKSRTLAGNWQILFLEPRLLVWSNPVWLQYVSHKVGRLLVPYALLTAIGSNMALAGHSIVYGITLAAQCALYLLAGYGAWLDHRATAPTPATSAQDAWRTARPAGHGAVNA